MSCDNLHWYVISVTGGKEIKTRDWLLENKERFDVDDSILDKIFLPVQKKISIKDGKKKEIENSLIGPYIYVHCDVTNEKLIDFFRQAPNVYSFVGSKRGGFRSGAERVRDEDINKLFNVETNENTDENTNFYVGDNVELISGNFSGFKGVVNDVNTKTNLLKVSILIFGRETIIEVQSSQVKKTNSYE